ncbi:MAG: aldose epimerase family protein, partial [Desulfobacterales bacterium]
EYTLPKNDGDHHLHGGVKGLSKVIWAAELFETRDSGGVTLSYISSDGEENYPGNLNVTVTYLLNMENELFFKYTAETDKETPVNLTNHTYWNLQGAGKETILDHLLTLNCSCYLPVTDALIPTGELLSVEGTPMDFRRKKRVGDDIQLTDGGYDHCFVINESSVLDEETLRFAARLFDPISSRSMTVFTDLPGVQLYTGNFLDNVQGMQKEVYPKHSALCLETEHFPDAVNHAHFPTPFLKPGKRYESVTMHRFSV